MGSPEERKILWERAISKNKANDKVNGPFEGDQDQVGVPQVPLLGHGDAILIPILA